MSRARVDLTAFVLAALPPPPARVLEVGCGSGKLARAVDAAGYRVLAIDPRAPEGPIFRRTTLAELDEAGPFEAAVANYSLHHIESLNPVLDRIATLLQPGGNLVIEEFGWDRLDQATAEWYGQQQGKRSYGAMKVDPDEVWAEELLQALGDFLEVGLDRGCRVRHVLQPRTPKRYATRAGPRSPAGTTSEMR